MMQLIVQASEMVEICLNDLHLAIIICLMIYLGTVYVDSWMIYDCY